MEVEDGKSNYPPPAFPETAEIYVVVDNTTGKKLFSSNSKMAAKQFRDTGTVEEIPYAFIKETERFVAEENPNPHYKKKEIVFQVIRTKDEKVLFEHKKVDKAKDELTVVLKKHAPKMKRSWRVSKGKDHPLYKK